VPDDLVLAADFPAASIDEWRSLVAKIVAKSGAEFDPAAPEQALASRTADGIPIAPLYDNDPAAELGLPGQAPYVRGRTANGNRTGWDVTTRIAHPDPKIANEQVLEDLAGGATSVWLVVGEGGVPASELRTVLDGVMLDVAPVTLDAGADARAVANDYLAFLQERRMQFLDMDGSFGLDPYGVLARTGELHLDLDEHHALAAVAMKTAFSYRNMRTFTADATIYHDAGATDVEELGIALATGVEYLRDLTEHGGMHAGIAFSQIDFRYAATADQFATIAKLRAARRLWSRIGELSRLDAPSVGQRQHVVTSWPMTTRQDPWSNILRGTLACFGACVGGADSITVTPFDAALGLSDPLARRIARNTPNLLVEESHIAAVIDPAGGAGYVEALTEAMAREAWKVFTEIEAGGRIEAVLRNGSLAERIATSREKRLAAIAAGDEVILGVNLHPIAGEKLLERPPAPEPPGGGLPRIRWAEALENVATQEATDGEG
jgi:methylmalonyl-CoA mutase